MRGIFFASKDGREPYRFDKRRSEGLVKRLQSVNYQSLSLSAKSDIFNYIEMFNNTRRQHGFNNGLPPVEDERQYFNGAEKRSAN